MYASICDKLTCLTEMLYPVKHAHISSQYLHLGSYDFQFRPLVIHVCLSIFPTIHDRGQVIESMSFTSITQEYEQEIKKMLLLPPL